MCWRDWEKKINWKLLGILLVFVIALVIINPYSTKIPQLDNFLSKTGMKLNLGLDLKGGSHLVYEADMSSVEDSRKGEALSGIKDVVERRVNAYGVAEPLVQTSIEGDKYRLIVELAGVKDLEEAKNMIKETPFLEFKELGAEKTELTQEQKELINKQVSLIEKNNTEKKIKAEEILKKALAGENFEELAKNNSDDGSKDKGGDLGFFKKGVMVKEFEDIVFKDSLANGQIYPELVQSQFGFHIIKKTDERGEGDQKEVRASHILFQIMDKDSFVENAKKQFLQPEFENTGLTGQHLARSQVGFNQQTKQPEIMLEFNSEGKKLFKEITERNIGKPVAIYLDEEMVSSPIVNDVIRDGNAVISGSFTLQEAKETSQKLNSGALPVPIKLVGQQTVEASLGEESLRKSLWAGLWGFLAIVVFMVGYYRLAGLIACLTLIFYTVLMVALFKLSSLTPFSITLTLSGIAGFILSIGMAVDANVLIFERMKEELNLGRGLKSALDQGFSRAWLSIRDGNLSTILTCLILITFSFGFIKGFALILLLGVLISMLTAIVVTKIVLNSIMFNWLENKKWILLSGIKK